MEVGERRCVWTLVVLGSLFMVLCVVNGQNVENGEKGVMIQPALLKELEKLVVAAHKNDGTEEKSNVGDSVPIQRVKDDERGAPQEQQEDQLAQQKQEAPSPVSRKHVNTPPREPFTGELSDKVKEIIRNYKNNPAQIPHPLSTIFTNADARKDHRDFLYFLHIPKTAGQTFHAIMRSVLDYQFLAKKDSEGLIYNWGSYLSLNETQISRLFDKDPAWYTPEAAKLDAPNLAVTLKPADIPTLSRQHLDFIKRTMMSKQCAMEPTCWTRGNKMGTPRFDPHFACARSIVPMIQNMTLFQQHYDPFDGLCGHFDTSLVRALAPRKVAIITFFRRPFDRFMSWYNYLRSNAGKAHDCITKNARLEKEGRRAGRRADRSLAETHQQGEVVKKGISRRLRCPGIGGRQVNSIEELIRYSEENFEAIINNTATEPFRFQPFSMPYSYTPEQFLNALIKMDLNNYVAKALSGCLKHSFNGDQKKQGFREEEMLEIGKAAIDSIPFIGLAERWNDSVQLFLYTFGFLDYSFNDPAWLPGLVQSHRNKSSKKFDGEQEDIGELRKKVGEVDYLDEALYKYAEKVFEERYQNMMKMRKVRLS
eukprot:TRINITY_DN4988_c0_g1_i2.p1 TRINITY_DN4988_c0_g1~~TRINITY_DN4988_c0_g1_i2.p1  ORF type:complete len:593 (-),score=120.20 TRINITY_DN4988_c0_g1_i2:185-1963(-)